MNLHQADFWVTKVGGTSIYFNQRYAWETTIQELEATIIHEFSHVGGLNDAEDMLYLGLLPNGWTPRVPLNTTLISHQLAKDCF